MSLPFLFLEGGRDSQWLLAGSLQHVEASQGGSKQWPAAHRDQNVKHFTLLDENWFFSASLAPGYPAR